MAEPFDHPTWKRLNEQIDWYDEKSGYHQTWHKRFKLGTVVAAGVIPLSAVFGAPPWFAAILGFAIVVFEGCQQLSQHQQNWIIYRSTAEALKHEKYLFLANAWPYDETGEPIKLLAERVEGLVSTEHAKWLSAQEKNMTTPKSATAE